MKKIVIGWALITIGVMAHAQDITAAKTTLPYQFPNWVIESNVKTPKNHIIKFYNAQQELIYQEEIVGKKINVAKPRVVKMLNKVLVQVNAQSKQIKEGVIVAALLK